MITGSVGFQAGISVSETVSLVMTEKASIRCCRARSRWEATFRSPPDRSAPAPSLDLVADFDFIQPLQGHLWRPQS